MRIVLMGPPGAGKGTQAKRLMDQFQMAHLSSGDIFRAEKASGSELGKKLAEYMNAGALVPDEIVVSVMAKAITENRSGGGLLLDGFPRTVPQAQALDEQLAAAGKPLDAVAVITANDEIIVTRITGRWTCGQCGRIYHVTSLPSKTAGVCDDDGAALTQRSDDKEEVVRSRLAAYYKQTEPVIAYYRQRQANVIEVDGMQVPDAVAAQMGQALEELSGK
ncbi:MAG: adenylate kinase [Phycisphaerae bacterium]|nr:adenylate kinase [Phycisphaerae bacterium]